MCHGCPSMRASSFGRARQVRGQSTWRAACFIGSPETSLSTQVWRHQADVLNRLRRNPGGCRLLTLGFTGDNPLGEHPDFDINSSVPHSPSTCFQVSGAFANLAPLPQGLDRHPAESRCELNIAEDLQRVDRQDRHSHVLSGPMWAPPGTESSTGVQSPSHVVGAGRTRQPDSGAVEGQRSM